MKKFVNKRVKVQSESLVMNYLWREGAKSFVEIMTYLNEEDGKDWKKQTDYISKYYLETVPESVKTAWQEAMEETNVNPFADGVASTLTRLSTEQDFRTGGDDNILGDTEESCLAAIDKVLERIENLTGTVSEKQAAFLGQEKTFYTALASKIKK